MPESALIFLDYETGLRSRRRRASPSTRAISIIRDEWKCDSLNLPSRAAAARLGFQYEGLFRQAMITRGRNRDTAWFSVIDRDWPALRAAFERWLDPCNFASDGSQRRRLSDLRSGAG